MIVLSTVRLATPLKEQLAEKFPDITFHHDYKMQDAEKLLPLADVILTYGEDLEEEHIHAATNLKWIMVASAGMDRMPFDALEERNILVTNSKGVHAIPMAEYCLSMMLQVSRQTKKLIENEQNHVWDRKVKMDELYGKTVYIIGAGAIGTATANLAKAFGMKVLGMNRDGRAVKGFDQMYKREEMLMPVEEVDFVISVLPSTEQTKGIIGKDFFQRMKKSAVFINIGRGNTVVEEELIASLEQGQLKHAVLDVFEEEPLNEQHAFWDMEQVTITPHLSGITDRYVPRVMEIFHKNLTCFIEKDEIKMDNKINLSKRY
ncbi:D-2-hydroxyacid dehydrogenase [Metabacillus sp. HB246100]